MTHFSLSLLLLLAACNVFGPPAAPLSDKCYTHPGGDNDAGAAQLALGSLSASYVPGRLLVAYDDAPGAFTASRSVRAQYGLKTLEPLTASSEVVSLPRGVGVLEMRRILERDARVRYAEPDRYLYTQATPNDPGLIEQWHMNEFGMPQAWALETGNSAITIAVLDSGVDLGHEDLIGRSLPGCDLYNEDNDANPGSPAQIVGDQRHGTHVAGIALATGDNGKGVAGVAYSGVKLLPVKVFDDAGKDTRRTATSVVAKSIRWAAGLSVEGMNRTPYPAQIINLSLGGDTGGKPVETLDEAIADAREAGSLVIAASGNSGRSDVIYAPANAPGALAVGSVDEDQKRSDFSNYARSGSTVDLMAPGGTGSNTCGMIYSTLSPSFEGATESEYGCERGTSMAAPFVAGVAALIWSQNPGWTDEQVEEKLRDSSLFTEEMNHAEYGAGIICADWALGAQTRCGK